MTLASAALDELERERDEARALYTMALTNSQVAEARVSRLEAALRQVEWINGHCPWCGRMMPLRSLMRPFMGHAPDCMRQRALKEER